jgi:hypothetical protein
MGASSSLQASQRKKLGHAEENMFNAVFAGKRLTDMNFSGSSEDTYVSVPKYVKVLAYELKLRMKIKYAVSLKSGVTWQFHLGRLDELSDLDSVRVRKTNIGETKVIHSKSFKIQKRILQTVGFWKKYLGKGELLCYINQTKKYTFFRMSEVINFVRINTIWRLLETGRLKGDILHKGKSNSVLTFEYRNDKKQFALGAMGGKSGLKLFQILHENIRSCEIDTGNMVKISNRHSDIKALPKSKCNGNIGDIAYDREYLYVCIGDNEWKRVKFSKW